MTNAQFNYGANIRNILLIADDDDAARVGIDAITMAGDQFSGRVSLASAAKRLAEQAAVSAILIELRGISDASIEKWLQRVIEKAGENETLVIVSFDPEQTELVAAPLIGTGVDLISGGDTIDRVAALLRGSVSLNEALGDARRHDAERLRALNSEVARITETLARLSRSLDRPTASRPPYAVSPAFDDTMANEKVDAPTVRAAIRGRRMRANFFEGDLFADPAWDMLLDLFAAELEFARVSVSSLCIAAAVPGTTALRWIGTMIETGLFERTADPLDRRRAYIALSKHASDGMQRYFATIRRAGLASA